MKKSIIIIGVVIIIGILIGVLLYKANKNAKNETIVDFDSFLESTIDEINDLNLLLTSEKVSDVTSYENEIGFLCKKYLGDDTLEVIDKLYSLYQNPFIDNGYFELVEKTDEQTTKELYVCLPNGCKPKVYDYKTATIEYDEKNKKIVNFTGTEFVINLIDNKWKFEIPAVSCPLNQDLLEITE